MINRAALYNKFVRYELLQSMLNNLPSTKNMTGLPINIYIDIQSVYKDILSTDFIGTDIKTIGINVLNMAAHYRHFFRNQFKTEVCVFLVDSRLDSFGSLCTQFNQGNNANMFNLVEVLCKYFPNIYYLHRDRFNAVSIIANLISERPNNASFVISNDIYSYQLPVIFDLTYVLHIGITNKYIITMNNAVDMLFKKSTPASDLSPKLLPLIMALNKVPQLELPLLFSYKSALTKLRELISKGYINPIGYNPPNDSLDCIVGQMFGQRWLLCDLTSWWYEYKMSPAILDDRWTIKKRCVFSELASILDSKLSGDPENILNYIYLFE